MSLRAPLPLPNAVPGSPLLSATPRVDDGMHSATAPDRRRLHSEQLFGPAQEVEIAHGDAVYRLRRTSLGKLILTK